jgi:hypothetical protein
MIDSFQKLAGRIRPLRFVAMGAGVVLGLVATAVIVFSDSGENDRYLIPSAVGVLWSLSTYVFIRTFESVPEKAEKTKGFWRRLGRRLHRGWYWLLAFVFIGSTVAAVLLTMRLVSIWFKDY